MLGTGAFIVVGAVASSVVLRRQVAEQQWRFTATGEVEAAEACRVMSARARAMGGAVTRCDVSAVGSDILIEVWSRGRADGFVRRLTSPGVISFHEAQPATDADGPVPAPPGFHAASFIDFLYNTTDDFGEKVERKTDLYLKDVAELTVTRLAGCRYHTEGLWRAPVLTFEFAPADASAFEAATGRLAGKPMAVCIDGTVRAAALVPEAVSDGKVQMRGLRDNETALELAGVLAAGALPCELTPGEAAEVHHGR